MRSRLRQFIICIMRYTGIIRLFQFIRRKRIVILAIHGVMDNKDNPAWEPLRPQLSRDKLDEYLSTLSKRYHFVSLTEAVEMLSGRRPVLPYSMVLTFDDGYRNNFTHALPVLRRYNAPATFFVSTGFLDNPKPFWWDRLDYAIQQVEINNREVKIGSLIMQLNGGSREALRETYKRMRRVAKQQKMSDHNFLREMEKLAAQFESESGRTLADIQKNDDWSAILSWKQISECDSNDITIGSHTADHIRLGLVPTEIAIDQLGRSNRDIESHTGKPCQSICFPNGSFTDSTIVLAKESGYICGVTSMEGINKVGDDVMTLRRIDLPVNVSCSDLMFRISVTCR